MRTVVIACALVAGCTASSIAHISASWSFERLVTQTTSAPASCPSGFDTAQIIARELDANLAVVAPPVVTSFRCDAGSGTTVGLPASYFVVEVDITAGVSTCPGSGCYAQSAGVYVDVTTVNAEVVVPPIVDNGGYAHLKWVLRGATSGQPVTCDRAGAAAIEVDVNGSGTIVSGFFDCSNGVAVDIGAGEAFTAPLLAGTYAISTTAVDAAMQPLGSATTAASELVTAPNGVTELGIVMVEIAGM